MADNRPNRSSDLYFSIRHRSGQLTRKRADAVTLGDLVFHKGELCSVRDIETDAELMERCKRYGMVFGRELKDWVHVGIAGGDGFVGPPDQEAYDTYPILYVIATYNDRVQIFDRGECDALGWRFPEAVSLIAVLPGGVTVQAGGSSEFNE